MNFYVTGLSIIYKVKETYIEKPLCLKFKMIVYLVNVFVWDLIE